MNNKNEFNSAYLYAFLSYVFEQGGTGPGDILAPVVKRSIVGLQKQYFTIEELQAEIFALFAKEIPRIVIQKEVNKLFAQEIISIPNDQKSKVTIYNISKELDSYEKEYKESSNRVDNFFLEFKRYLERKYPKLTDIKIGSLLKRIEEFCKKYFSGILVFLFEGKSTDITQNSVSKTDFEKLINSFIETEVKSKKELLDGFSQIFHGVTLLSIVERCSDQANLAGYNIGEKTFYLDTNILVRMVGLQSEYYNSVGKELYDILNQFGFKLKVFRITVNELEALIRGYKYYSMYYVKGRDISHVYQVLRDLNYSRNDIEQIIEDMHTKLLQMKIEIDEDCDIGRIDYTIFEDRCKKLSELKLQKFKSQHNLTDEEIAIHEEENTTKLFNASKHDLKSIYLIKKLRNGISYNFEKTNYYFITAEGTLIRYSKSLLDFDRKGQAEAIGDAILSFLLYFKNPNNVKGISVRNFINAHFDTQQLSPRHWMRYVDRVYKKYKNKEISDVELGYLLTKTMLDNDRIVTDKMDEIINDALAEYTKKEEEENIIRDKKSEIEKDNMLLSGDNQQMTKQINELTSRVDEITDHNRKLSDDVSEIKSTNQELLKSMKIVRKILFALFTAIFIFSLILMLLHDFTIGGITMVISIALNVLNIIDHYKKIVIKD